MTIGYPQSDGFGVWTDDQRTVVFYLEHDTGYEALAVLSDKVCRYEEFVRRGAPAWPVLFWLHSTAPEGNLRKRFAETARPRVPIATAARDRVSGLNPAQQIWNLFGDASPLRRLAELPMPGPIDLRDFEQQPNDAA